RFFQTAHFYVEESSSPRVVANETIPIIPIPDDMDAIPVKQFVKHVMELYKSNMQGFAEEFEGYNRPRAYIAAQGPLKSTFEDFWRMVWEQNTGIIVMITNLVEKGRRKCDQYWPMENSEQYGNIVVTLKSTEVHACYTLRRFLIRNTKVKKKGNQKGKLNERIVVQYHYTQWPDMGVPEYTLPVLTFINRSSAARTADMGPVLVHCRSNEFIITQHPLPHTTTDFWRMIWDHNAQIIVMLPDNQGLAEDEFVYWPSREEAMNCIAFTVTLISKDRLCLSNEEQIIIHDFILEATQVRHFQCPKWPNPDAPLSSTFELISVIKEEAMTRDGPTIVHDEFPADVPPTCISVCSISAAINGTHLPSSQQTSPFRCGAVSAGMLCALTTLSQQLESEGVVDIYQVAKMINLMRPGVFTDIEQYQYLYKAMLSLVSNSECSLSPTHMDTNGVVVIADESDPAESMESLV
ncbi:hypothetical protein GOODEAATRI_011723, partial [Goodea atripinnis]